MSSPSSTTRRSTRLLTALSVVVALLLVAELGARSIESHLPAPLVWHSAEAQTKVAQMDHLRNGGGASMVFLGTSLVIAGADARLLDPLLPVGRGAYNAALASGVPSLMAPWYEDVVNRRLHPSIVVIGLSSYDLEDDAFSDYSVNQFLDSPAGRQATGHADALEDVDWWLRQHSAVWANRSSLRDPSTVVDAIRGKQPAVDAEASMLDDHGVLLVDRAAQVPHVDVSHWALGQRNVAALRNLITVAQTDGQKVVLVEMPVTDEFVNRHPHGDSDYTAFLGDVSSLARTYGITTFDYSTMRDRSLFADDVHLNSTGAKQLTTMFMRDLQGSGLLAGVT